ncbi:hypothetical protein [Methanobrevibacter arboriphilus]|uniref:hypothetical protein n=1 Tax=Methanobrevibacter arboriphilus TaxID=39441 RepID=UPI000A3E7469|nr:hypothetical protein [Methanobrevibacter arboriphilus]
MNHEDIKQISREIDCDVYTLQQFRNNNVLDENLKDVKNPNPSELKELAKEIKPILKKSKSKNIRVWRRVYLVIYKLIYIIIIFTNISY